MIEQSDAQFIKSYLNNEITEARSSVRDELVCRLMKPMRRLIEEDLGGGAHPYSDKHLDELAQALWAPACILFGVNPAIECTEVQARFVMLAAYLLKQARVHTKYEEHNV